MGGGRCERQVVMQTQVALEPDEGGGSHVPSLGEVGFDKY